MTEPIPLNEWFTFTYGIYLNTNAKGNEMTEQTEEEVQELVDSVLELTKNWDRNLDNVRLKSGKRLILAIDKFRKEKPALVRRYSFINDKYRNMIEATPEVIARLGPTAGVTTLELTQLLKSNEFLGDILASKVDLIESLYRSAMPEIEGKL